MSWEIPQLISATPNPTRGTNEDEMGNSPAHKCNTQPDKRDVLG